MESLARLPASLPALPLPQPRLSVAILADCRVKSAEYGKATRRRNLTWLFATADRSTDQSTDCCSDTPRDYEASFPVL